MYFGTSYFLHHVDILGSHDKQSSYIKLQKWFRTSFDEKYRSFSPDNHTGGELDKHILSLSNIRIVMLFYLLLLCYIGLFYA